MKILGLHSGHDCSFCILEDGIPTFHAELERYIREIQPKGDAIQFFFDECETHDDINYFTHTTDISEGGISKRHANTFDKMNKIVKENGGSYFEPGHHQSHAANAFFSSNYDDALIVTIDGGGPDPDPNSKKVKICTFTIWKGKGNKIYPIAYLTEDINNILSLIHI